MSRGRIGNRNNPLRTAIPRQAVRTNITPEDKKWAVVDVLYINSLSRHQDTVLGPLCEVCQKPAQGYGYKIARNNESVFCCSFCTKERTMGEVHQRIDPIANDSIEKSPDRLSWDHVLANQRHQDSDLREEVYMYLRERPLNIAKARAMLDSGERLPFMDSVSYELKTNPMKGLPDKAIDIAANIMAKEKIDQVSPEVFIPQGKKIQLENIKVDSIRRTQSMALQVNFRDEKGRQFSTFLSYDSKMDDYITDLDHELLGDWSKTQLKLERGTVKGHRDDKKVTYLKLCKFLKLEV